MNKIFTEAFNDPRGGATQGRSLNATAAGPCAGAAPTWVALFDLDGTLTWHDTLLPFLAGYLRRRPRRALGLWRLPMALFMYWRERDRGELKSRLIRMLMRGETRDALDAWADAFVASLQTKHAFRPLALGVLEAHRKAGDHLVLLSASPDLYVARIGRLLGFEHTLCTEILWNGGRLDGRLKTANRRGEEKRRCLDWVRAQHPGACVIAYGNSASDLEHMRAADRALLVNGDGAARRLAAKWHVPVSNWS